MKLQCAHCGIKNPMFFLSPEAVWEFYVPVKDRKKILCLTCFKTLVDWKDGGAFELLHGKVAGWPGGYPLPRGGYAELDAMTDREVGEFYHLADGLGHWKWLDALPGRRGFGQ
jgi:hypothetical protein